MEQVWEVWWCYDGWHPVADRLEKLLPANFILHRIDSKLPVPDQVRSARVLIPTTGMVDGAVIRAAEGLQLIAQPAAGYCNIAVDVAKKRNIPITIAPGVNSQAVAEVALMMMLMLFKRVDLARVVFSKRIIGEPAGLELHGKTLGMVGYGNVGKRLGQAAQGLGMKVIGLTSSSTRQDLEAMLQQADIVSLHCPLNERTRGMIGLQELNMMKPDAILINCARGDVINKAALLAALEEGKLGGVGLDVHWVEPADPTEPLYQNPKVLALPHMGTLSQEAYDRMAEILAENIIRVREGRELLYQLC